MNKEKERERERNIQDIKERRKIEKEEND